MKAPRDIHGTPGSEPPHELQRAHGTIAPFGFYPENVSDGLPSTLVIFENWHRANMRLQEDADYFTGNWIPASKLPEQVPWRG